jgi:hypothetical protein
MNGRRGLVLDANILIRAVFGRRVREILEFYEDAASFCSPGVCFQDARKYIPELSERRTVDAAIRFGQRIRTSLVASSLLGPPTESSCIYVHLELGAPRLLYPPPTLESSGPAWRSLRCHLIAIGTYFSNRAHPR